MRDQLRDEVRAAFQKEQAAHPPASDLRSSIMHTVTARPARRPNLQWIAVAAALLITALVIVSLVSSRVATRSLAPAHSSPSPTAAANGDYGPPPPGVSLFYLRDPDHAGWYVGFDWSGMPRATLKLPASDPTMSLVQSADGSFFIYRPGAKGGGGQFYDRLGKPLAGNGGFAAAVWADDNTHQCGMAVDESAGQWILATQAPGQPARTVATIAPYSAGDQAGLGLMACSFRNDRAVLQRIANSYPTDLWVIRLSDGKVLTHSTYIDNGSQLGQLTASPDGSLVALNSSKATGGTNWFGPTTIVRASDGALVAKVDASYGVLGFSADDKTVLVTTSPWIYGAPTHLAILALPSGDSLWHYDGPEQFTGFFTNPSGAGFAVMLQSTTEPAGPHPTVDVVIVNQAGEPLIVPSHYQRP